VGAFQVRGPFVSPNGHQAKVKGAKRSRKVEWPSQVNLFPEPVSRSAHKPGPPGELDELPPTDRTVDDSMILSEDALVHTPPLALIVAE